MNGWLRARWLHGGTGESVIFCVSKLNFRAGGAVWHTVRWMNAGMEFGWAATADCSARGGAVKVGRQITDSLAGLPLFAGPVRSLQTALRSRRSRGQTAGGIGPQAALPAHWLPSDPHLLHVIAVSHEASRSGAPQALLRLVRHARS